MLMEKRVMQHLKSEMQYQKEITINSHFWLHFKEKQMAFNLISFWDMLITSIIIIKKQGLSILKFTLKATSP
jgi:hypothetical protein